MSDLTLYVPKPDTVPVIGCSPPSWMVRLALEEKGLDHRLTVLDFGKGEHRSKEMRAISPKGTIPVLTDGTAVLTDTFAMLTWLEMTHPSPSLLGSTPAEKAAALDGFQASAPVKQHGMALLAWWMRTEGTVRDDTEAQARKGAFAEALSPWNAILADAEWAAGAHGPTLADLTLFTYFTATERLSLVDAERFEAVAAHGARMRERPPVVRSWPFDTPPV